MRKVVHVSDLHFGQTDPVVLPALASLIREVNPDLIAVSGDLTQRARNTDFAAARDYLDSLAFPRVVVPGNHDVPLYNLFMRAFRPMTRYRKYFGAELAPFHADDEIAVVGINTARSMTFKDGRINRQQVEATCRKLHSLHEDVTRIVVTHHPFEDKGSSDDLVGRASMAMAAFSGCRIDVILSGHLHAGGTELSATRYDLEGYSALMIQAGTATSVRRRDEPNSFNILQIERRRLAVEHWIWNDALGAFAISSTERFEKTGGEWRSAAVSG